MASDSGFTAGWYPDPRGTDQLRYHDGTVWTDHLTAAQPGGPATSSVASSSDGRFSSVDSLSSIGSLLSESWRVLVKRIGSLIGVTVAAAVVAAAFVAIFVGILASTEPSGGVAFLLIVTLFVLVIAVYAGHQLIVARIFVAEHFGVTLSVGDAWAQTKGRIIGLAGTYIGVGILTIIGFLILGLLLGSANRIVTLVVLFAIVAVIWVKTAFIATAAAATGSGSILERSTRVSSRGRFWAVAVRLLCLWVVSFVFSFIMQRVISAVSDTTSLVVAAAVVQVVGSLLVSLFYAAGAAKIFLETGGSTNIRVASG